MEMKRCLVNRNSIDESLQASHTNSRRQLTSPGQVMAPDVGYESKAGPEWAHQERGRLEKKVGEIIKLGHSLMADLPFDYQLDRQMNAKFSERTLLACKVIFDV